MGNATVCQSYTGVLLFTTMVKQQIAELQMIVFFKTEGS